MTFIPEYVNTELMNRLININNEDTNARELESLVQRLSRHLSNLEQSTLPIGEAKSEMIRRCHLTQINPKEMPKSKSNFVNCNKTVDALNKILFQQQLIKCNKQLSSKMI